MNIFRTIKKKEIPRIKKCAEFGMLFCPYGSQFSLKPFGYQLSSKYTCPVFSQWWGFFSLQIALLPK